MRKLAVFTLFISFATCGFSQNQLLPDTLKVQQIAQEEGLSQLNVLSVAFDNKGYVWAGTEDGLNRFNGYEMRVFSQENDLKGLPDDHIRSLLFLNDTLWLATNTSSINAYVLSEDKVISVINADILKKNQALKYAYRIFELDDRYLLAGTLRNCVLIDRKTLDISILPLPDQARNDYLLSIYQRSDNEFLLGTFFDGVLELNLSEKTLHKVNWEFSFENNPVYAFHQDGKEGLFIGSEKGLFHYDKKSESINPLYKPTEKNPIRCFYDWNSNQVLIGCFNGLMALDRKSLKINPVRFSNFSKNNFWPVEIVEIKKDAADGIWMASEGKGLFYYHPKRQKFEASRIYLPNFRKKDFISSFNFLREGNVLWMTTEFGFVRHELNTRNYKLYRTNRLGYALTKDANNVIWGGGFNQGLQRYNRKKDRFENVVFSQGKIPDKDIVQITAFANDSLWVATWSSGMYSVNLDLLAVKPLKLDGKSISRARTSFVDSHKRVWIGADDGLYRFKDGKVKHFENDPENTNSLSNNRIFSIAEDMGGNLAVGTAKGLNRIYFKNDSVVRYEQQPGLPNDFIYGVLTDRNGHVWVSTNYGISKLEIATGKFKNYTEADGLQNNEFNGKAAYKDSLGYMYFGGMNGFNIFHPDSVPVNLNTGKTIIESVELFGKPIEKNIIYSDTLYFQHNENVLTFHFSALNFLLPRKNRYQFKMEGFDKQWRPVTNERSTTYTNLNPGTYTFKVKGSNNEMLWGKPDAMTIVIPTPWYNTLYFKIGIGLVLLLLLISWFFFRNYEQNRKNKLLQEMVLIRTKALNDSNEDLSKAITRAKLQKENISFLMRELNHRVKNNLQLMASLLEMQKGNTLHKLTQNNLQAAQNRLFTIAKIHDLLADDQSNKGSELDVFISKLAEELLAFMEAPVKLSLELEPLKVASKKMNPLGIIINELITNTIKHAFLENEQNGTIHISLKKEGEFGKLVYGDNGQGISNVGKNKESLGLKLIRNLAVQLGGRAEIASDKGTVFTIYFAL